MARVDTELLGLQIVSLEDASVVGEVDGLIIDDKTMKVAGFVVDLGLFEASVLPFGRALAVGEDAIIVGAADSLAPITADGDLDALATKDIAISDARVMTRAGKTVGSIGDFYVDTDSGDVVGMEFVADDQSIYPKEAAVLPSAAVLRLGRDIVVVSDDYLQRLQHDAASLDRLTRDHPASAVDGPESPAPPATEPLDSAGPGATAGLVAGDDAEFPDTPTITDMEEPAITAELGPVAGAEQAAPTDEGDLGAEPGAQPRHFLIGKRVLRRIDGVDGEVIAEEGDLVTYEMIQRARNSDQLLILSLNVE